MSDLRDWLAEAEGLGEVRVLRGIPWDLDMGAITELVGRQRERPALLFDDIPGYPSGHRVLTNPVGSWSRFALAMGLPPGLGAMQILQEWRSRSKEMRLLPPRFVASGPVMENVLQGEEVDLLKFPVPKWHEKDGGRFIGTGDVIITRQRDGDWVNLGTYRVMVHDRNRAGLMVVPIHHGYWHMQEWFARGEPMPVAIVVGMDPLLFLVSASEHPAGTCEYDWAGAIRGEPVDVMPGPITRLPIPAGAEIVLEGFIDPEERLPEGPFGEFTGYYAGGVRPQPVVRVEAVYYRNNPIILGVPPLKPPNVTTQYRDIVVRSSLLWDALEASGVPDVAGVWCHIAHFIIAIAVRQRYPGHAKQAGRIAAACGPGMNRYFVVVDEDIDVTDLDEVLWAMCTRVDPDRDIEILPALASTALDPMIPPERKAHPVAPRVVIDATRPYEWRDRFPEVVASSAELKQQVLSRWGEALKGVL